MKRELRFLKFTLIFAFILSVFTPYLTNEAVAATKKYTATVISSSVKVRDKASTNGKVLGTLKKGTKLTVYAKTKSGWSEIRYKSKKAYVQTKSLKFTTNKKTTTGSYSRNTKYLYTYEQIFSYPNYITYTAKYTKKDKDKYNVWEDTKKWVTAEKEKETKDGLYIDGRKMLSYPIKVGKKWESKDFSFKIIAENITIETKAGKFKNVVRVDGTYYSTISYYFAKGYGLVYAIDLNNIIRTKELISIKKK